MAGTRRRTSPAADALGRIPRAPPASGLLASLYSGAPNLSQGPRRPPNDAASRQARNKRPPRMPAVETGLEVSRLNHQPSIHAQLPVHAAA
ncbi:hypothetical protein MTO96_001320 [Rhipicephalus appendiculatus]